MFLRRIEEYQNILKIHIVTICLISRHHTAMTMSVTHLRKFMVTSR